MPAYVPPGTPTLSGDRLNPRLLSLSADPMSWTAEDEAAGWILHDGSVIVTPGASGGSAMITEGAVVGGSMADAEAAIGKPYRDDGDCSIFFFEDCVLALYGKETVEAAAIAGIAEPGTAGFIGRRLARSLYEYRLLYMEGGLDEVVSPDGSYILSCSGGERPFLAVRPSDGRKDWIVLYGASREYYWVNAHTFLSIDADSLVPACHSFDPDAGWPAERIRSYPLVDIRSIDPDIRIDMKYATEDNFVKTNLYGDFTTAYMPPDAAQRLAAAHAALRASHPDLRFLVYDAYRPKSAQQRMWDIVQGTEYQAILSDPSAWFSNHYIGMAVDLTLYDTATGTELDMGTGFDSFDRLAWPQHEAEFLASGRLSPTQYENRRMLRDVMEAQGFAQLYFEWWQYDLHMPGGIPGMFRWFE